MENEDAAEVFARLAVGLRGASQPGVQETAQTLVQFAVHALGCVSAGLALSQRGVLQVPLREGRQMLGVLGLHSSEPDGFSVDDEAIAELLSRHASIAVATARRAETVAQAVDARKVSPLGADTRQSEAGI